MKMIDPTYLRIINDGLISGSLNINNASSLPMGLVGMYEDTLPPASNVNERKKFLDFFSIWALLKKDVSLAFVIPLLEDWTEETIIYYMNKYSKWFNSTISGKYELYHDKLRAFIITRTINIVNKNDLILKKLLLEDEREGKLNYEVRQYLQEFYGVHLAISSYYKTDDENAYNSLKNIDYFIHKRNWVVKKTDRIRWNKVSAILACMDVDLPFLKQIVLCQDKIINESLDIDLFISKALNNDYVDIDDLLIYKKDVVEQHIFLFILIFRLLNVFKKNYADSSNSIKSLNNLIKRLNLIKSNAFWIIPEEIVEKINIDLSSIRVDFMLDVELIDLDKYVSDNFTGIPYLNFSNQKTSVTDYYFDMSDYGRIIKQDEMVFEERIKNDLLEFIQHTIRPEYIGESFKIEVIRQNIFDYRLFNDKNGALLFEKLIEIKEAVSLTDNVDINDEYNDIICRIIWLLIIRNPAFSELPWLRCFCGSSDFADTLKYYKVLSTTYHQKEFNADLSFSFSWSSRDQFLTTALSVIKILINKGEIEKAFEFYEKAAVEFLNYKLFDDKYFRFSDDIIAKEFNDSDCENLLKSYNLHEFRHIPTISFCLCNKFGLLELINILNDDNTYLSGVSENKKWINELLEGVVSALGLESARKYVLDGLNKYTSVMGGYNAFDYSQEASRPRDNIWKIEWWVIGNVVYGFHQLAEKFHEEQWSDYSSANYGGDLSFFDDGSYYTEIEEIFERYGFKPEINLYVAIDEFKNEKPVKSSITLSDIMFDYNFNPVKALLKFNKISDDRTHINCLAAIIANEEADKNN